MKAKEGDIVTAKRLGWDEKLTPVQELDHDPYDHRGDDDLRGVLTIIESDPEGAALFNIPPFTSYLVDGQEADGKTIKRVAKVTQARRGGRSRKSGKGR